MTFIVECKLFQIFIQISEDFFRKINVKTRFKMSHFPTTMKHKTLIFLKSDIEATRRKPSSLAIFSCVFVSRLCVFSV